MPRRTTRRAATRSRRVVKRKTPVLVVRSGTMRGGRRKTGTRRGRKSQRGRGLLSWLL